MLVYYLQMLDTPEEKVQFEQIYMKYRGLMYHVAENILHDSQEAEDAVHNAFLRISKRFSKSQNDSLEDIAPMVMNPDDIHIPKGPEKYADLQEALTAYGIDRPVVPKQLPEGFTLDKLIVDRGSSDRQIVFFASYHQGENHLIIQVNIYIENEYRQAESFWDFQKDEGDPIPYETGGVTHLLATNAGRPMALWANGPAECSISGDITMEELKQLIDSIYEKD